jgi:hypothetical protein
MPTLLLHAVTPAPPEDASAVPTERGLRGQALRVFRVGELAGWATVWEAPDTQVGRSDLFDHHRVVQVVWEMYPCLPTRFPTWVADEHALENLLEGRWSEIHAALERVRDRAEIAVTLLWDTEKGKQGQGENGTNQLVLALARAPNSSSSSTAQPSAANGPGRRYLEACRQNWVERDTRKEVARRFAQAMEERLAPWVVDRWYSYCPSEAVALSGALLVPVDRAAETCERLREMAGILRGARLVVNGPWPPYTFSRLGGREMTVRGRG